MTPLLRFALLAVTLASFPACAFHTTAEDWSGRVGASGRPVFYTSTTKVGMNLFVVIPVFGDTAVDGMVNDLTEFVAERGGDRVRMVQGTSENYWYGFPPLTWIFTPVISSVDATWEPSQEEFATLRDKWAHIGDSTWEEAEEAREEKEAEEAEKAAEAQEADDADDAPAEAPVDGDEPS